MVFVGRPLDHRSGRWASGALALVLPGLVALLGGCAEQPSFELRWRLVDAQTDPDAALALSTVEQCSQVGVSRIRVTTRLGADTCTGPVVDAREYPCFPTTYSGAPPVDEPVDGPTLEPGVYTLVVEGLRRTGEPWACEQDICDPDPEAAPCIAQAATNVSVAKGGFESLAVVLLSPNECDDGVDNDRDGRVDGRDPACILDPAGREATDANVTVFQTSVSFLDRAVIKPFNVGVDSIRLEIDGELLVQLPDYQLDLTQWPFRLPLLSRGLEPGEYELTATALGANGEPLTEPVFREVEGPTFPVVADEAAFAAGEFVFTSDRFLAPIIQPIAFTTSLLLAPGDTTGASCLLGGYVDGQRIALERVWIRVTDGNQTLNAAALGLTGSTATGSIVPTDEVDGWVSFDCPTSTVSSVGLTWGAYDIEIQGRIGADVCFETPMITELAPQPSSAQNLNLERVLVDATPPAACIECSDDTGCTGQVCVNNVCVDK